MVKDTVTMVDWLAIKRRVRMEGWMPLACWIFEHEPSFYRCVVGQVMSIRHLLQESDLDSEQLETVMKRVTRLSVEPLAVLLRAQQRLLKQFLSKDDPATAPPQQGEHHE